jgi:hypothetical protein
VCVPYDHGLVAALHILLECLTGLWNRRRSAWSDGLVVQQQGNKDAGDSCRHWQTAQARGCHSRRRMSILLVHDASGVTFRGYRDSWDRRD